MRVVPPCWFLFLAWLFRRSLGIQIDNESVAVNYRFSSGSARRILWRIRAHHFSALPMTCPAWAGGVLAVTRRVKHTNALAPLFSVNAGALSFAVGDTVNFLSDCRCPPGHTGEFRATRIWISQSPATPGHLPEPRAWPSPAFLISPVATTSDSPSSWWAAMGTIGGTEPLLGSELLATASVNSVSGAAFSLNSHSNFERVFL